MDGNQPGVQLIESEEDKKKKGPATQPGSAFAPTGPSASSAPSGTQQARAAQAAGPTRGTGFTGVGRFLQANVGSRLGQEVAGRVSQAGQQAASRLGQAAGQFQQQLGQKQQQLSAQQQAAQSALQRIAGGVEQAQPVSFTPSQEEVAAYQAVAGGQIQAPTGLEDVEGVRAQAQLAGKLAKGTQTAAGRTGLLQQVVGRGPRRYTAGQSALDALILGQAGSQLAQARRSSAGLERQLSTQERLAEEQARQFGAESEAAKQGIIGKASGFEQKTKEDILKRRSDYETELDKILSGIREQVPTGSISSELSEVLSGYGVTPGTRIYDRSLSELANFLAVSKGPAEEISATTKQEAAQLEALKQLSGFGKKYSEEEKQKLETTIDPKTGLAISPEKFKETFIEPGVKGVVSAANELSSVYPEFAKLSGFVGQGKTLKPNEETKIKNEFSNISSQKTALENQANELNRIISIGPGEKSPSLWQRITNAPEASWGWADEDRANRYYNARFSLVDLTPVLNETNKKHSVLNKFLTEYNKGQTLSVLPKGK